MRAGGGCGGVAENRRLFLIRSTASASLAVSRFRATILGRLESFNICKAGDVDASGGSMDGDFGGEVCRLRRLTAGEGTDGPLKREAVRRALSAPSWSKRAVTNPGNRVSSRLS